MPTTNSPSTTALSILAYALQRTVEARAQRAADQAERERATQRLAVAFGVQVPAGEAISLELVSE